jgi:sulfide:quinone oxidoreductase
VTHHQVIVIGGGNAGLSVAGRLRRSGVRDVAVVEPRGTHIFQPLQSHIAGGRARASEATRPQAQAMPRGVEWIRDSVSSLDPASHSIALASGGSLTYDSVVVCPGISRDWEAVPGLAAAMRSADGVSNYELDLAHKASLRLRDLRRGTVVFVQPRQPASCNDAAQKPMYLACDWWRAQGVLDDIRVVLVRAGSGLFPVAAIDAELRRKVSEYGIEVREETELAAVDPDARTVTLTSREGVETLGYDLLHAAPPQSAPAWLAASGLSDDDSDGFVAIDPETFRSTRHPDVWSLGDAAATRSYKSGGAIRKQAKILVQNLRAADRGRPLPACYNGYGVCPVTVSRDTVVFAEFDRSGALKPTVPFWHSLYRERRLSWIMDRHILPWVYWHMIVKGRA